MKGRAPESKKVEGEGILVTEGTSEKAILSHFGWEKYGWLVRRKRRTQ